MNNKIFLPGTDKQISIFLKSVDAKNKSVLIIGSGSEEIAKIFSQKDAAKIYLVIDDQDSLVRTRLSLKEIKNINIRFMEFDNMDFMQDSFDVVYAQALTGTKKRNKIIKEINRVLKPGGNFCVGEIVSLSEEIPQFVKDIWEQNNLAPLFIDTFKSYYTSKEYNPVAEENLSGTLKDFYSKGKEMLSESSKNFSKEELKDFNQLMKTYKHEANAYLKLGGDKYIGYKMLILQKVQTQE